MKQKVYIETTVVSYYTGKPTRDLLIAARQEEVRELWPRLVEEYDSSISALVLAECRAGNPDQSESRLKTIEPYPLLDVSEEAEKLSQELLAKGAVPDLSLKTPFTSRSPRLKAWTSSSA